PKHLRLPALFASDAHANFVGTSQIIRTIEDQNLSKHSSGWIDPASDRSTFIVRRNLLPPADRLAGFGEDDKLNAGRILREIRPGRGAPRKFQRGIAERLQRFRGTDVVVAGMDSAV